MCKFEIRLLILILNSYSNLNILLKCKQIYKSLRHMNVEIVTEAAQFPEKEYINGTFLAMYLGFLVKLCSR